MFIKMLETRRGSEDGSVVRQYHQGDIYEVADALARSFIRRRWAVEVQGEVKPPSYSGILDTLARANIDFDRLFRQDRPFRPQPTRGSAPANPATLLARGEEV